MSHQDQYGTEFDAAKHPTRTIPAAHRTRQTLQLMADNRFEEPIIHVMIVDWRGVVTAMHDAPRGALATGLADLMAIPADQDEPTGETPPESTLEDLKRASDTTVINNVVFTAPAAPLTVADLSAKHIGKTMRITNGTDVFTGHLTGIEFKVDRKMWGDSASAVRALFDDSHITYPLTATVEVL